MTSTAPAPRKPLNLVLHMGTGKTGTSSIQHLLYENRDRLADLGYLYPQSPGRTRHTRLGLFIRPVDTLDKLPSWRRERFTSPGAFRRTFRRRLFKEIDESGLSNVVFSDEALYGVPDEALRRLRRFTHRIADSIRLVVYLRRQDDHLVSLYQQEVKVRESRKLSEWAQQLDHSRFYDYHARLRTFERLLVPDKLVVRRFERDSFVDGSLYQDFLDAAGIDVRAEDLVQVPSRNESLDAEAVEFLRIVNILRRKSPAAAGLLAPNQTLAPLLAAASTGPVLTLPRPALDAFMGQWNESNQRVALEFVGDTTGLLFHQSRKTRGTTTEQCLDPARFDHFVTLLQLPHGTQEPLRKLVEREAKVR